MNIYKLFVTITTTKDRRGGGKITRVTLPYLVAETTAAKAMNETRRAFKQLNARKQGVKITFTKPDCIISNR